MAFLWFLAGLGMGLAILGWSIHRTNRRIAEVLRALAPSHDESKNFSILGRLIRRLQQQQQVEQTWRREVQLWQQILQAAPIGYIEVDQESQLCWSNAKACQLLQIEAKKQAAYGAHSLLQVVRSYELDQLITQVQSVGEPQQQDWTVHSLSVQHPERSHDLPLRGYGVPLANGHVGVFLEDRQEVVTLAADRDRWTSDVAHELKTPLTSLRLVAEMLQGRVEPDLKPWVDHLIKESVRLSVLVQDVLELSQLSLNQIPTLKRQRLDLPSLVRSAWLSLEFLADAKNLSLYYQGPDQLTLDADEARLHRALLNLMDNSIKFSPQNTAIIIQVSLIPPPKQDTTTQPSPDSNQAWVGIDVIDSGKGFPEDALSHVFKRFYRADPSRTRSPQLGPGRASSGLMDPSPSSPADPREFPLSSAELGSQRSQEALSAHVGAGSGLGLAIVQQIVAAHGGMVSARNHPQTGGAWVRIQLPRCIP